MPDATDYPIVIGPDGYLRAFDAEKDDPNRYQVERAGRLILRAESGPYAAKIYECDTCGHGSRGDMSVFLDAAREHGYCDACWTALRREGRIVDGTLVSP